jgi:hypothetical protein
VHGRQIESLRPARVTQKYPIVVFHRLARPAAPGGPITSSRRSISSIWSINPRADLQWIHDNGHMVMLERNNLDVAALLRKSIAANVK